MCDEIFITTISIGTHSILQARAQSRELLEQGVCAFFDRFLDFLGVLRGGDRVELLSEHLLEAFCVLLQVFQGRRGLPSDQMGLRL